jgi:hypothetical protein
VSDRPRPSSSSPVEYIGWFNHGRLT